MSKEIRLEIMFNGFRWGSNIITEVIGNHSSCLSPEARTKVKAASSALQDAIEALRKDQM